MHPLHRWLISTGVLLFLAGLLAACGGQTPTPLPAEGEPTGTEAETAAPTALPTGFESVSPLQPGLSPLSTPTPALVPEPDKPPTRPVPLENTPPVPPPLAVEVPQDLLNDVLDDLAERLGASRAAIEIEQAGAVIWRDGSLGCPQKGMMYTQALVPGYQIVLEVSDKTYDYHASEYGSFVLCAAGLAQEGLPPGAGVPIDR